MSEHRSRAEPGRRKTVCACPRCRHREHDPPLVKGRWTCPSCGQSVIETAEGLSPEPGPEALRRVVAIRLRQLNRDHPGCRYRLVTRPDDEQPEAADD